jgi:hypothetical protein
MCPPFLAGNSSESRCLPTCFDRCSLTAGMMCGGIATCQGLLRHSTGYCPNPATYVIDVEDTMYAVCNEHLRAFRRDVRL